MDAQILYTCSNDVHVFLGWLRGTLQRWLGVVLHDPIRIHLVDTVPFHLQITFVYLP